MHAAQTDRLTNTLTISTLPTIWDRLKAKGVRARYNRSDFSFLWLWGTKYDSITFSHDRFLQDAKNGTLPKVAFVEPRFAFEEEGISNDDHPHADIRAGDAFLAEAFHAVSSGPSWGSTIFIVTYDEWGGFFEHVAPPRAAAPNDIDMDVDADAKVLLGLRIPVVVASPFTRDDPTRPHVNSTAFDNTSILKLIETRWGLAPLTARDASSDVGDLTSALNLTTPDRRLPALPNPAAPTIRPCTQSSSSSSNGEPGLSDLGQLRPGQ
jgi:phospholipase C